MKLKAIFGALLLAAAGPAAMAQTPVKIGFVATLSGPAGALGQDQYDAFMMVVERNGGKLGGVPVQVLKEDDQLKPDVGVQIIQKFVEKDKTAIVTGVTFSNVMMAMSKPLAEGGVLFVGSNAGPAPLAGPACNANFFFTSWQNDMQAEVMGKYATDKGYKKVYGMAPNYQAGKDFVAGFKRFYKGQIAGEVYTTLNQPDYSAEISQIAAAKPDAVYVFYPGGMGVNFVKQYKQAGLLGKIPLLSTSTTDGATLPALKDTALGVVSGTFWGPDFDNAASKTFVEQFERKFNRIPSQYAAQSYDAAVLLDVAMAKVKGNVNDKAALRAAVRSADFKSVRGPFTFNNNGFPIQNMYAFVVAKDARGRVNLKTIAQPITAQRDSYADKCPLK
ncbi:MAG TPA: ABC transporter substrate-binding protein [Burkholderiales bacterium]